MLKVFFAFIILILVLVIIASPLTKYVVEKYDIKYTGREIEIGHVLINPLFGTIKLKNLRIYDQNSDSVFISASGYKADLSIVKLLTGTYHVSSMIIDRPIINIVRRDSLFNFSDLIDRFLPSETDTTKKPARVNILNIKLNHGKVNIRKSDLPINLTISRIDFSSTGKFWDRDSIEGEFLIRPDTGEMKGGFMINTEKKDYMLRLRIQDLNLALFDQLLSGIVRRAALSANLNMDIQAKGNYENPTDVKATGMMEITDFHFDRRGVNNDMAAFKKILIKIDELDLKNKKFYIDSIVVDRLSILYERYDSLDNFRRIIISKAVETEKKVDSVNLILKIMDSDYYVNVFEVREANFRFNDYSIAEKFSMALNPFNIKADSINKANKRVRISIDSKIKPYGALVSSLSMDPKNERNFDITFTLTNMPASMFNPYIGSISSYQLDRGKIEMYGNTTVRDGMIRSLNHFLVINPDETRKIRKKDQKWVPVPLIMALVRERGSIIDYEIPITGNLKDPEFHLSDVFTDLLKNILVKPPTTPYRFQVKNVEEKIEKTLTVKWKMRQTKIEDNQAKFIKGMAKFLKENKEARILVHPVYHEQKEKENILFFEAKKKYFFESRNEKVSTLSENDSIKVEKLSSKDSSFVRYLDKVLKKPLPLTIEAKCYEYTGREIVSQKFGKLVEQRKEAFMKYFIGHQTEKQIDFLKIENEVPFNWFSYFRIDYKGDVPESLVEAFDKLYEINSEPPLREFFNFFRRIF